MALPAQISKPRGGSKQTVAGDESLLKTIGRKSLSGLAAVGNLLDTPGSMVRDTLALENPFDNLLSPLSGENRVSGRDLLERYGVLGPNKKGLDWGDALGFAAEVGTDPLSFVSGAGLLKATGKGGQVLKRAGALPKGLSRTAMLTTKVGDIASRATPDALQAAAKGSGFADTASFLARHADDPVGGNLGIGLPFKSPSFTVGSHSLSKGLDAIGGAVKASGPVRALRGVFDPSVLGKFGKAEQELAPHVYQAQRSAKAPAAKAILQTGREWDELYGEFNDLLGDQIRKGMSAPDVDPRELDAAIGEVMDKRLAQWNDPAAAGERQFRAQYKHLIPKSRKDVDPDTISHAFDTITDEYRNLTGNPNATPDDALAALQRADPRPVRTARDVIEEAEGLVRGGKLEKTADYVDLPFKQGDVVIAGDRGNYGYVQQSGGKTSNVLFRNPETGAVAVKNFANDELTRAFEAGSDEAVQFSQIATRKVFEDTMRAIAETQNPTEAFRWFAGDIDVPPGLKDRMSEVAETARAAKDEVYAAIDVMGGRTAWHGVDKGFKTEHFPRNVTQKLAADLQKTTPKAFPTSFQNMKAREPTIRDLPTYVVNELTSNPRYRGEGAAKKILDDYGDKLDESFGQQLDEFDFGKLDPELGRAQHAEALATWIKDHPKQELFARAAFEDFADYQRRAHRVAASLKASHGYLAQHAVAGGEVPLVDVFRRAGMDEVKAAEWFQSHFGIDPQSAGVSQDVAQAVSGLFTLFNDKLDGPIAQAIDRFNRAFKSSVTVLFPSFMARNATSGQFVNVSSGYLESAGDVAAYTKELNHARDLLAKARSGKATGEDLALLDELQSAAVFDKSRGYQDVDFQTTPGSGWLPDDPRQLRQTARGAREGVALDQMGIDRVAGVLGARRAFNTAVGTGSAVNQHVEWFNRVPMYLYLRKKGYAPEMAAEAVERLHFDYSDISPVHRDYIRRAVPFSTFTRKIAGLMASELAERPGGLMAQSIRASNQRGDEPMPDYVAQTAAIPLGELPDGSQRFITGLGLPYEDPLSFGSVRGGLPDLTDTLAEGVSRLNPLIKAPLELAAGESFFQRGPQGGRELGDMDPTIGRTLTNVGDIAQKFTGSRLGFREELPGGKARPFISTNAESLLGNLPTSRAATTMRTLTDARKWSGGPFPGSAALLNLGTGIKVSDIAPSAQDALLRDELSALSRSEGANVFESVRFTRQQIAEAERDDPQLAARMRALNAAATELTNRAKARKAKSKKPASR